MGRTSVIERHKKREQIERDIINGVPTRQIKAKYKISLGAIQTYKTIIAGRIKNEIEKRNARSIDYIQELEDLRQVALHELHEALKPFDLNAPLPAQLAYKKNLFTALGHAGDFTDRLARFTGQSLEKQGGTTNVQINVFEVMPIIRATLMMYPDALAAVDRAIKEGMNGNGHHA